MTGALIVTLAVLSVIGYYMGRSKSVASVSGEVHQLHSRPGYYGFYVAIWTALPAFLLFVVWQILEPQILRAFVMGNVGPAVSELPPERVDLFYRDVVAIATEGVPSQVTPDHEAAADHYTSLKSLGTWSFVAFVMSLSVFLFAFAYRKVSPTLRARNWVERVIMGLLIVCSVIAILTTVGIILSLLFESLRFFNRIPIQDFLFGLQWSPQTALRAEQVGASGAFGAVPLFAGTFLITIIAMTVALPVGLMSAVYFSEYAGPGVRGFVKPMLEILAGVPTVVYGFFALLTVAPFIRDTADALGVATPAQSALAAGSVMGIMLIPFISSLSDDVINSVPQSLRDGSFAMGATKSETIRKVVLPAALPGIVGAVLLAVSRAIGETMIVVMAAGRSGNLTFNPLDSVTTITVQIVALLTGDQEFDSAKTLSAFALGLTLFFVTLVLNVIALNIVQKYRERYD